MEINGEHAKYRINQSNRILNTFYIGDLCDFREEDGRYHSGYRLLNKSDDNKEFVFQKRNGEQVTIVWWVLIDMINKDALRISWNFNEPYPLPAKYEFTVEEIRKITEFFRSESKNA